MPDAMPHIECAGERDRLRCHCLGAVGRAREVLSRQCHRCPRSHLVNVKTLLAVLVYLIISHAFLALTDGIGPHTGERCLKYGHFFIGTLYVLSIVEYLPSNPELIIDDGREQFVLLISHVL